MVTIEKVDSPLFEAILKALNDEWKGKPIDNNINVTLSKEELLPIIGEDDFAENLRLASVAVMKSRFKDDGLFMTLCPNVGWDGKELTVEFRKEVIPYLLYEN